MELVFTGEFPPMKGGIGNFLYSRCLAPPEDGLRILAATSKPVTDWDQSSGLDIERFYYRHTSSLNPFLRMRQLFWARRALTSELHKRRYRLITTNVALPFGWMAVRMRKLGHKVGIFCHSRDILRPNFVLPTRLMYKDTMKNCDLYIANSTLTAEKLVHQGWEKRRMVVIHPPVDGARFHPGVDGAATRREWTQDGDGPIILSVSRLDEIWKGQDTVIRTLPKLRTFFPELRYVIVGDGPCRPLYKRMARDLGVERHVVFTGSVSDESLPGCYAACDVFILLSRTNVASGFYEGFGIVYREAMASGKPVIASKEAGIRDLIRSGENGLLVNPRDEREALCAIKELLSDRAAATQMGQAATEAALAPVDWTPLNQVP